MVSQTEWMQLKQQNDQLRRLLERDIRQLWTSFDLSDRGKVRQLILEFAPQLVDEYGRMNASLTASFLEDVTGIRPVIPAAPPAAKAEASARWAIGPLWEDRPNAALSNLTSSMTKQAKQYGRDTTHASTIEARGYTYARVPRGSDTCDWCKVYASRGAVYGTERSAGGEGNDYHDDCWCEPVAVKDESDLPPGYDPDALYAEYKPAYEKSPSNKIDDVAKTMAKIRSGEIKL